jgi:hypothetical protein
LKSRTLDTVREEQPPGSEDAQGNGPERQQNAEDCEYLSHITPHWLQ